MRPNTAIKKDSSLRMNALPFLPFHQFADCHGLIALGQLAFEKSPSQDGSSFSSSFECELV